MDFDLNEEQRLWRKAVHEFVAKEAIVSSGYSESSSMSDYQAYGFKGCLSKPYRIDELRNMLSSLLS